MSLRLPEVQAAYTAWQSAYSGTCAFCDVHDRAPEQIVESSSTMLVLRNTFPYTSWDGLEIAEHLMLIPKRHTLTLSEFTHDEQQEYFDVMQRYEHDHHSVYLRSQTNATRTVGHLHTHLFKPVLQ